MDHETQLIKNLETQLKRLINELEDLEETKLVMKEKLLFILTLTNIEHFRDEIDELEYNELKGEFLDQTKEFSEALERMSRGDVTLNTNYAKMKLELRNAISNAFNLKESMKIFGLKLENELEKQLNSLKEDYKLKRIGQQEMELKRIDLLNKIKLQNEKLLTKEDLDFLEFKSQQELLQLNVIDD